MSEIIDINDIHNLKTLSYETEEEKSLTEGIEDISDPNVSIGDVKKELGRDINENFYNQPTEEALFNDDQKKAVIEYPLILLKNIYCPEILDAIVTAVDRISIDSNIKGGFINLYYADDQGMVRYIGYKKLNTNIFMQMRSFLCEPTYYVSKGQIEEIKYEDFMDFEKMKPKILITDSSVVSYKDKTNPLNNYKIAEEAGENPMEFQLKVLEELQAQDKKNINKNISKSKSILPNPHKESTAVEKTKTTEETKIEVVEEVTKEVKEKTEIISSPNENINALEFNATRFGG